MKTQISHTNFYPLPATRSALIAIAGVVIAIICSVVVVNEIKTQQDPSQELRVVNAKSAITRGAVEVVDLSVTSFFSGL